MTIRAVTASTTALKIVSYNNQRQTLIITNNSGATVFISQDPSNITSFGTPLFVGESLIFIRPQGDEPELDYFAQTLVNTADLRIIEGTESITPPAVVTH